MKLRLLIPILIVAAGIVAYYNSFHGPFIFDDVPSIVDNPHIRHLRPIGEVMSPSEYSSISGRPVVCLSLALNYAVDGLHVRGYHAFNLLVHLLAALVLFGILRRTFEDDKLRKRFGNAAVWLAAMITLLWEVHPLQSESVTYIVERTESLMGLFLLLTLYCTLRGARSTAPGAWYLAAVISCALGMGSKEVMVVAPLLVLLYDRAFLTPSIRESFQRRGRLYVGLATTWIVLAVLVARTTHLATGFALQGLTPWYYLKTEAGVILHYLCLCFWPHPLAIDYSDWPITVSLKNDLAAGLTVITLLAVTLWALRQHPRVGFLGAWFFLILAPTSSILPSVGEAAAERRMYLPLAAVVTMAVLAAFAIGTRLFDKRQRAVLGTVVTAFVIALFTFLTIQRNRDYRSALIIWQDTVKKRPSNPRARHNLGVALGQVGRVEDAIVQFEAALRLNPDYAAAHNDLGTAFLQQGRLPEAIEQYKQALQIYSDNSDTHFNLGTALLQLGDAQEAIGHFEQALHLNPDRPETHYSLGLALDQVGLIEEAIGHYEQALFLKPDYAEAHTALGVALFQQGRVHEAINHYQQALRLNPDLPEAHYNLGIARLQLGNLPEAIVQYEQALQVKPDYAEAHYNFGAALLQLGNVLGAIGQFEQAICYKPDYAEAYNNLGVALFQQGRLQEAIGCCQQALQLRPDLAEAHYDLGVMLKKQGHARDAVQHFEIAVQINPDFSLARDALTGARMPQ